MAVQFAVDDEGRTTALIATHEARFRAAFLAAIRDTDRDILDEELIELIEQGRHEELLERLSEPGEQLAETSERTFIDAAHETARWLNRNALTVQIAFDRVNTDAVFAMQQNRLRLVREFTTQQTAATRQALLRGILDGANPRAQARAFRDSIGLTQRQEAAVANFRRLLSARGDGAPSHEALTRRLRDRRFDRSIQRAQRTGRALDSDHIDRMVTRYRERYLKYRSEVIARTEAMRSVNQGADELYRQAIASGRLHPDEIEREWVATSDARTRDSHSHLNGQTRGLGESWQGLHGTLRYPGDPDALASETAQCRCTLATRIVPRKLKAPNVPEDPPPPPGVPRITSQTPIEFDGSYRQAGAKPVTAIQMDTEFEVAPSWMDGGTLKGKAGDWKLSNGPDDQWLVERDIFAQTYRQVDGDQWVKHAPIQAKQMDTAFEVETLEGVVQGRPGDWLAQGVKGERWPIPADAFERKRYTLESILDAQDAEPPPSDGLFTPPTVPDGTPVATAAFGQNNTMRVRGVPGKWDQAFRAVDEPFVWRREAGDIVAQPGQWLIIDDAGEFHIVDDADVWYEGLGPGTEPMGSKPNDGPEPEPDGEWRQLVAATPFDRPGPNARRKRVHELLSATDDPAEAWRAYVNENLAARQSGDQVTVVNPLLTEEDGEVIPDAFRREWRTGRVPNRRLVSTQDNVGGEAIHAHLQGRDLYGLVERDAEDRFPQVKLLANGTFQILDGNHRGSAAVLQDPDGMTEVSLLTHARQYDDQKLIWSVTVRNRPFPRSRVPKGYELIEVYLDDVMAPEVVPPRPEAPAPARVPRAPIRDVDTDTPLTADELANAPAWMRDLIEDDDPEPLFEEITPEDPLANAPPWLRDLVDDDENDFETLEEEEITPQEIEDMRRLLGDEAVRRMGIDLPEDVEDITRPIREFAPKLFRAVRSTKPGFGENMVWIHEAYETYRRQNPNSAMTLDQFKARVSEAFVGDLVGLRRAELPALFSEEQLEASRVTRRRTNFSFIRNDELRDDLVEPEVVEPEAAPAPVVEPTPEPAPEPTPAEAPEDTRTLSQKVTGVAWQQKRIKIRMREVATQQEIDTSQYGVNYLRPGQQLDATPEALEALTAERDKMLDVLNAHLRRKKLAPYEVPPPPDTVHQAPVRDLETEIGYRFERSPHGKAQDFIAAVADEARRQYRVDLDVQGARSLKRLRRELRATLGERKAREVLESVGPDAAPSPAPVVVEPPDPEPPPAEAPKPFFELRGDDQIRAVEAARVNQDVLLQVEDEWFAGGHGRAGDKVSSIRETLIARGLSEHDVDRAIASTLNLREMSIRVLADRLERLPTLRSLTTPVSPVQEEPVFTADPTEDRSQYARSLVTEAQRRAPEAILDHVPMRDLLRHSRSEGLTRGQFADHMRALERAGAVRMQPHTGALYDFDGSDAAIVWGQEIKAWSVVEDARAAASVDLPTAAEHRQAVQAAREVIETLDGRVRLEDLHGQMPAGTTIGQMHDALRELANDGAVDFEPYVAPMYQLEGSQYALVEDRTLVDAVTLRRG